MDDELDLTQEEIDEEVLLLPDDGDEEGELKSGPKFIFGRPNPAYTAGASKINVTSEMDAIKKRSIAKYGKAPTQSQIEATFRRNLARRQKQGIASRAKKKFGKAPTQRAVDRTLARNIARDPRLARLSGGGIPMKAETISTGHYRVLAIPFGGPLKAGRDLDREFFSERTDIKPDWFPERPVLWHHGQDQTVGDEAIGKQGKLAKTREGWWGDIWLDRQSKYFDEITAMIEADRMYGSSASMPHLVKKASNGELLVWPHVEQTLSPVPRNPFAVVRSAKAWDDFTNAGIDVSAFKGLISDLDMLTTDLASDLSGDGDHLSPDGGDPAMARLAATLDQLDEALRLVT